MTVAFVFPGQGAQRKGMELDLLDRFPELCAQADEAIGRPVRRLCSGAEEDLLHQTQILQPVLFTMTCLTYLATRDDGSLPSHLAGHSLGEYTALFAAGCFDFATGLRLVRRRGELMAQARGGGMLAVVGLELDLVLDVLVEVGATDVDVANVNSPEQIVVAGPEESLRALVDILQDRGATKCVLLNVSIAAHSRYMTFPAETFAAYLRDVPFAPPRLPVISNVTVEPHRPETVRDLLRRQICSPVRWWDTMRYLAAHGVHDVREMGPGQVLTKLWNAVADRSPAAVTSAHS